MTVHLHNSHGPCLTRCGLRCDTVPVVYSGQEDAVTCAACRAGAEMTPADHAYEAGVNDAATLFIRSTSVYTGGILATMEEAAAYRNGQAWAYNHREEVEAP